ncbi:hypothetical protein [Lentzea sp. NPDC059081]|uniref:hypothetical protein n=1 Tax=Lentzea sp. NPDC059081 TaxID=3346719 RepID=UPI00368A7B8B
MSRTARTPARATTSILRSAPGSSTRPRRARKFAAVVLAAAALTTAAGAPAAHAAVFAGYEVVFQAPSTRLWVVNPGSRPIETPSAMAPGTSPSVARMPNGNFEIAFVASNGELWVQDAFSGHGTGFLVASNSSPSIATDASGNWVVAVQGTDGRLWLLNSAGGLPLSTASFMEPGTSPAIARLSTGNVEIAFAASNGELWLQSGSSRGGTGVFLWPGTSPAITANTRGGWVVAAQDNTSRLWTVDSSGKKDKTPSAMNTGTSPSITWLSTGDFEIAFAASSGELWVQNTSGGHGTGIFPGSSPSVAADSRGGWTVAFLHAFTGTMWVLDSTGPANDTGVAVATGTGPAITALQR